MTDGPGRPGVPTRLAILAEIRFYREGLGRYFSGQTGCVVHTARDVSAVRDLANEGGLDVVLVDMATLNGPEAIRAVRSAAPDAEIVAVGVHEEEREVVALAEAGAIGFVSREASLEDLRNAVASVARNESACSGRVAAMLVRRVRALADVTAGQSGVPLTRRQLEIVELIEEGLPNKAIAQRLFIELPTVKNHVHNILERLGVHHREEAASAVRRLSTRSLP